VGKITSTAEHIPMTVSGSHTGLWQIPGLGALEPCLDRVVIVSPHSVGRLMNRLPIAHLKRSSHSFKITTYQGSMPDRFASTLSLTGAAALQILANHEHELGGYSAVAVEVAFDIKASSLDGARQKLFTLMRLLGKRRHQRGFVRCQWTPNIRPPEGCVLEPTFYFEHRKSGVNLKCYIRHRKRPLEAFGGLVVRVEWTLSGKAAIVRHLGGNQISDLLKAKLNDFLKRNLLLERIDHVAFGKLFRENKRASKACRKHPSGITTNKIMLPWRDPDYRAQRAAFLVLRTLGYREHGRGHFPDDTELAIDICQHSPAQIRGYLRERKKEWSGKAWAITDYDINNCFRPVQLTRVRPRLKQVQAGYNHRSASQIPRQSVALINRLVRKKP
jgi:hypothetical protein